MLVQYYIIEQQQQNLIKTIVICVVLNFNISLSSKIEKTVYHNRISTPFKLTIS